MSQITVLNLKTTKQGIRCDRGSTLGNPFLLGNELERRRVIEGYRRYLWQVVHVWDEPLEAAKSVGTQLGLIIASSWRQPTREQVVLALQKIEVQIEQGKHVTLLCWCAPSPCHCDVIANYLRWWLSNQNTAALDL